MNPTPITLQGLVSTCLLVSLLIALFLPLRPLLRRFVGSQWLCVLWLAVLVRLMLPVPMEFRWSLLNHRAAQPVIPDSTMHVKVSVGETGNSPAKNNPAPVAPLAIQHTTPVQHPWSLTTVLGSIWAAGFAIGIACLLWQWHRTRLFASRTHPATDERWLRIYSSIPAELRRGVELRMTDALEVPSLAGIFRPKIWMPESWLAQFTDAELRNVLLHELGHACRRDLLVQWLFALAQCIHWFNPLVWIAARAARFDREMACDAWVLRRIEPDASLYGAALVKTVQLLRNPLRTSPATVAMASNRNGLFARIAGISSFQPAPAWRGALGIALMIAVIAIATTSHTTAQETTSGTAAEVTAKPAQDAPANAPKRVVNVKTHVVIMREDTWKKLCAENPEFKDFAGKFPELDHEKMSDDAFIHSLNNLQKEAWEVPGEIKPMGPLTEDREKKIMAALQDVAAKDQASVKTVAAPTVTTLLKQRAVIEVVREFRYPSAFEADPKSPSGKTPTEFTTKNIGVTIEAMPMADANGVIETQFTATLSEFLGFLDEKDGVRTLKTLHANVILAKPVFSTATGSGSMNLSTARSILLGGVMTSNAITKDDDSDVAKWAMENHGIARNVVLVFLDAEEGEPLVPFVPVDASKGAQIEVRTNFFEIREAAWKKLCADNPNLKEAIGVLPPKMSYAELEKALISGTDGARATSSPPSVHGVLDTKEYQEMLASLGKVMGASALQEPSFVTKSGVEGKVEMFHELRYPTHFSPDKKTPDDFKTRKVGIAMRVTPVLSKEGTIDLSINPDLTSFAGYLQDKDGKKTFQRSVPEGNERFNQPIFDEFHSTSDVTVFANQTVLLGTTWVQAEKASDSKEPYTQRMILLIFVTAKPVDPANVAAAPSATPAPAENSSKKDLPYGTPVQGKPGFVTSPYSPEDAAVDVRGFPADTEVKDPYTGKIFLVP